MSDDSWSAENTTPEAIEAALIRLLARRHEEHETFAPARVVNLVAVCDQRRRGDVVNRIEQLGHYRPSRTVVCVVEEDRTVLGAWVMSACDIETTPGSISVCRERVEIDVGPHHLPHLANIVNPTLARDVTTIAWSPHGHPEALESLKDVADVVLVDSTGETDPHRALARAGEFASSAYVVDLAWLRTTPWRERIAATFDPPLQRALLSEINAVTVRHEPRSTVAGLLLIGWLASRLSWTPCEFGYDSEGVAGHAHANGQSVALRLEQASQQSVPGLAGVSIATASGTQLSLDRGPGGLHARRTDPSRRERTWTILGASRGETGILGEGIRQALFRDPMYRPALDTARGLDA